MLCLSRKKNEVVVIGGSSENKGTVTVLEIQGDKVRLGFDFPSTISVHREEVQKLVDQASSEDQGGQNENNP